MHVRLFAPLLGLMAVLLFSANAAAFEDGVDYKTLSQPQPTQSGDKVEVVEMFWYGCGHCFKLEPKLQAWLATKPDYVEFRRVPAVMGRGWATNGRAYFALEMMGEADRLHEAFFKAIHEERLRLFDEESIADWVAKQGVDREKFLKAYRSFIVDMKVRQAAQYDREVGVDGVPAFVINGKYTTGPGQTGGNDRALEVVSYLVAVEAGATPPQGQADAAGEAAANPEAEATATKAVADEETAQSPAQATGSEGAVSQPK